MKLTIDRTPTLLTAPATVRIKGNSGANGTPLKIEFREGGEVPDADSLWSVYQENTQDPLQSTIDFYVRSATDKDVEIDYFNPTI